MSDMLIVNAIDTDWACVMEPVEEIELHSETLMMNAETMEVIGFYKAIKCPGIISDAGHQGTIMEFVGFEMGQARHEIWKREVGKK